MVSTLKLPVGIDSFEKIRRNNFYYIDKTKLIEQLVETGGEVTLFTRPRRFGKTPSGAVCMLFVFLCVPFKVQKQDFAVIRKLAAQHSV